MLLSHGRKTIRFFWRYPWAISKFEEKSCKHSQRGYSSLQLSFVDEWIAVTTTCESLSTRTGAMFKTKQNNNPSFNARNSARVLDPEPYQAENLPMKIPLWSLTMPPPVITPLIADPSTFNLNHLENGLSHLHHNPIFWSDRSTIDPHNCKYIFLNKARLPCRIAHKIY